MCFLLSKKLMPLIETQLHCRHRYALCNEAINVTKLPLLTVVTHHTVHS